MNKWKAKKEYYGFGIWELTRQQVQTAYDNGIEYKVLWDRIVNYEMPVGEAITRPVRKKTKTPAEVVRRAKSQPYTTYNYYMKIWRECGKDLERTERYFRTKYDERRQRA